MVSIKYSEMLLVETEPVSLPILFVLELQVLTSEPVVVALEHSDAGSESEEEEDAPSFTPVRRNLLCFWVCSLTPWIGMSHSVQSIALSSMQNIYARLSCNENNNNIFIQSF